MMTYHKELLHEAIRMATLRLGLVAPTVQKGGVEVDDLIDFTRTGCG